MAEYEVFEDDDTYVPDRPRVAQKRRKAKIYTPVRCGWCGTRLKVYDDQVPDNEIEAHVARGECTWLSANNPQKLEEIRNSHFHRVNAEDSFDKKRRRK
jgi:hypothetical protein